MLLICCISGAILIPLSIRTGWEEDEKKKELQEDKRDEHHSSAVQQCMNPAGSSIILTLPLIYLIIFLSMRIITAAVACVMNSLFD